MALTFSDLAKSLDLFEVTRDHSRAGILEEALIQLANQKDSHFGQVVILAGGAGSGKGTILKNLLDIKGKVFDVDELKSWMTRIPEWRKELQKALPGVDLDKPDWLSNPDNVSTAHGVAKKLGIEGRQKNTVFDSVMLADPRRKPNLIFDVTLKEYSKLEDIIKYVTDAGYQKQNVHIVWVLSEMTAAIKNNASRTRQVKEDILIDTHEGASATMAEIVKNGALLRGKLDGNIVVAFNTVRLEGVSDTTIIEKEVSGRRKKASYISKAIYVFLKKRGQPVLSLKDLKEELRNKLLDSVTKETLEKWRSL
nr:MAG TPA: Zeta toxin [Caudoviricetes sp.]